MSVKLLKLISGEVIMADVSFTKKSVVVRRPMTLMTVPRQDSSGNIAMSVTFLDFIPGMSDNENNIDSEHIITVANPNKNMFDTYDRLTNPNHIEVAQTGLVVPNEQ